MLLEQLDIASLRNLKSDNEKYDYVQNHVCEAGQLIDVLNCFDNFCYKRYVAALYAHELFSNLFPEEETFYINEIFKLFPDSEKFALALSIIDSWNNIYIVSLIKYLSRIPSYNQARYIAEKICRIQYKKYKKYKSSGIKVDAKKILKAAGHENLEPNFVFDTNDSGNVLILKHGDIDFTQEEFKYVQSKYPHGYIEYYLDTNEIGSGSDIINKLELDNSIKEKIVKHHKTC